MVVSLQPCIHTSEERRLSLWFDKTEEIEQIRNALRRNSRHPHSLMPLSTDHLHSGDAGFHTRYIYTSG
jgi:hypothetical protein